MLSLKVGSKEQNVFLLILFFCVFTFLSVMAFQFKRREMTIFLLRKEVKANLTVKIRLLYTYFSHSLFSLTWVSTWTHCTIHFKGIESSWLQRKSHNICTFSSSQSSHISGNFLFFVYLSLRFTRKHYKVCLGSFSLPLSLLLSNITYFSLFFSPLLSSLYFVVFSYIYATTYEKIFCFLPLRVRV